MCKQYSFTSTNINLRQLVLHFNLSSKEVLPQVVTLFFTNFKPWWLPINNTKWGKETFIFNTFWKINWTNFWRVKCVRYLTLFNYIYVEKLQDLLYQKFGERGYKVCCYLWLVFFHDLQNKVSQGRCWNWNL